MLAYGHSMKSISALENAPVRVTAIFCKAGQNAKIIFNRWGKATSRLQSSCWSMLLLPFRTRQQEDAEPVFPDAKRMDPVEFD